MVLSQQDISVETLVTEQFVVSVHVLQCTWGCVPEVFPEVVYLFVAM